MQLRKKNVGNILRLLDVNIDILCFKKDIISESITSQTLVAFSWSVDNSVMSLNGILIFLIAQLSPKKEKAFELFSYIRNNHQHNRNKPLLSIFTLNEFTLTVAARLCVAR